MLDSEVITDSRKFEQKGVWLSLLRVVLILISHELHLHRTGEGLVKPGDELKVTGLRITLPIWMRF